MEPRSPILSLEEAGRVYSGEPPFEALKPASLEFIAGDFVSIIGRSGSGKSTLLNLLGMLDAPTSGLVRVEGRDVATLSDDERSALRGAVIGFVFQSFHLMVDRTAAENVAMPLIYRGIRTKQRDELSRSALQRVGLGNRLDAFPTTMSGGERQRVAIARALANRTRALLCDEPTGNLDSRTAGDVLDLLESLNSDGLTIVVVTHDSAVAQRTGRWLRMDDGLVSEGRSL